MCDQNGTAPGPSTALSNPPLVTRLEGVGVGVVLVVVLLVEELDVVDVAG